MIFPEQQLEKGVWSGISWAWHFSGKVVLECSGVLKRMTGREWEPESMREYVQVRKVPVCEISWPTLRYTTTRGFNVVYRVNSDQPIALTKNSNGRK
jgi:hypothetical protein